MVMNDKGLVFKARLHLQAQEKPSSQTLVLRILAGFMLLERDLFMKLHLLGMQMRVGIAWDNAKYFAFYFVCDTPCLEDKLGKFLDVDNR